MDQDAPTLSKIASHDFVSVPGSVPAGAAAAEAGGVTWLIVTDEQRQPAGLLRTTRLRQGDERQPVGSLIKRPVIVLPSHVTLADSVRAWPFSPFVNEIDGIIVVDDADQPVGVWGGTKLESYIFSPVRGLGYVNTGLGGPITNIGRIIRRCLFTEPASGVVCMVNRSFSAPPNPMPDCKNPLHLTPHQFAW